MPRSYPDGRRLRELVRIYNNRASRSAASSIKYEILFYLGLIPTTLLLLLIGSLLAIKTHHSVRKVELHMKYIRLTQMLEAKARDYQEVCAKEKAFISRTQYSIQ